jgi:hypothetical protein
MLLIKRDIQYNVQKKKDKTNNDPQNATRNTKIMSNTEYKGTTTLKECQRLMHTIIFFIYTLDR